METLVRLESALRAGATLPQGLDEFTHALRTGKDSKRAPSTEYLPKGPLVLGAVSEADAAG